MLLPPGVSALLPNLQVLAVVQCVITPAARTTLLDAACSRLHSLAVGGLSVEAPPPTATASAAASSLPRGPSLQQLATAQLRQLSKLPSLSAITLRDAACPTLFFADLGAQLTCLRVDHEARQCLPGTETPTPGWMATLQHVARCTRLVDLIIPCGTPSELGVVAPALQQLRSLRINGDAGDTDGDAVLELLLGLPHLTRLELGCCAWNKMRRWHNDRPCRWQALSLGMVSANQLARLPLHSLKEPVCWSGFIVQTGLPVQEVRAAVANVTQRCPAGFRWVKSEEGQAHLFLGQEADASILRALQPLLVSLTSVGLGGAGWDVERFKALGEVLPRTCTHLVLSRRGMCGEALEAAVARSLPWVQRLEWS